MISLTAQAALELPVDELALHVLEDMVQSNMWNSYNYSLQYNSDASYSGQGAKAIAEAVQWLSAQGMLASEPGNSSAHAIFVTRRGHEAIKQGISTVRSVNRLQGDLHPLIEAKARRQFLLGEYENAIFVSMKAIEVRVRQLAGFGDEVIGSDLMIKAFKPGGPLADPATPSGEVDGTMMLFRGAYAVLRNPSGHREVSFDDVTEAAEAVMTASLLMRMLDKIERRLGT
ncbi:TIGR02391 family protein [Streptomyces sp. DSM 3412]|uniref:TIGR02391 family protein n=1 Tax=Streptomyces gottesmaniae TaxID=3075518 RepID=A0ABU2YWD4_9ACTN|nr:TIGR02391 family protein [Streptomyces sp. DSM 3412]MDT0568625.1 TIGR02391 family protein [Streptomyces sp. DSM 3412]